MKSATSALVFCVGALLALGIVMLYSASMVEKGTHYLKMQAIWGGAGVICCALAMSINYRVLRRFAWPMLFISVILLAAVLVPNIGYKINGARRWVRPHPSIYFQPSEVAKIALIIALAWYGERYQRQMTTFKKGIFIPCLFIAPVLGLILIEPDFGSTVLLAGVSMAMLIVAGIRWWYVFPPIVACVGSATLFLWHDPVRRGRVLAWLHPEEHKMDVGWQSYQGLLAFGSGGVDGLGLGNSRAKLGFLPEHHTDFIFPIIGEELGLIATLLVVLAFIVLVICGIYIASRASDTFGMLLATGITFLIGMQAMINIGVVTSVFPNKGLPLPFISYGGSNLLVMLTCVGVLLSIARRAKVADVEQVSSEEPIPTPQLS